MQEAVGFFDLLFAYFSDYFDSMMNSVCYH